MMGSRDDQPGAAAVPVAEAVPHRLPPAIADQTGYLLRLAYVRAGELATELMPPGTTVRFYGVLISLTELGPRSQSELSKRLHVNRTMMVELIDAMEQAGLVERRRNPTDRRSYALEPTAAGREALKQIGAAADRVEAVLTRSLTGQEGEHLRRLLRAIVLSGEEDQEIPDTLTRRTGYLISAAHLRLREQFDESLQGTGVTAPHYATLATIAHSGPISQQQAAEQLGFTGTAVLQVVDRLESDGVVERRRNPDDRRAYALELTPKGRAVLRRAQQAVERMNGELAELLGGQSNERELYRLLRKLLALD
jgi:DNA-binding MarR family transcriptional regulator